MDKVLPLLKKLPGYVSVQRVVCGGCLDFKVITKLKVGDEFFGKWESAKFEPETKFLEEVKKIDGITNVETQTFTLEEM